LQPFHPFLLCVFAPLRQKRQTRPPQITPRQYLKAPKTEPNRGQTTPLPPPAASRAWTTLRNTATDTNITFTDNELTHPPQTLKPLST
jgi:hypothetical protein